MSDLVRDYLLLGLRLGRHVEGLVDSYYGPPELATLAEQEGKVDPTRLAEDARSIAGRLDELDDPQRVRWLAAQVEGLETTARKLAGEEIPYAEEVRRCYGVEPAVVDEDELRAAHRRLDEALPGTGDLLERYQAWRRASELEPESVLPAFTAVTAELRGRVRAEFGLPDGERADLELVRNEPWGAFNYYLGGLASRVVLNVDLPTRRHDVVDFAAHELYPGHHTEHALKEDRLVGRRGYLEESIFLVGTPQSLVSEGIASTALEILGAGAERACAEILSGFGAGYDVEATAEIRRAAAELQRVYDNLAELVNERGASVDEAVAYGLRWSLRPEPEVRKIVEFVTHPTWRAYAVTYSAGERLAAAFHGGDPARFAKLLTEQLTTADLLPA